MSSDCINYVRFCSPCQQYKSMNRKPVKPLGLTDLPNEIWQHVYMDHWTVGNSVSQHKGVLGFIDGFSKYAVLVPVHSYSAEETVAVILNRVATNFGLPEQLHSDRGSAFASKLQEAVCNATGTVRRLTVAYRPQANGQIERLFRTIRAITATISRDFPTRWPEMIPHAQFAYNTAYHRAIDNTPFFLMFGRDPTFSVVGYEATFRQNANAGTVYGTLKRLQEVRSIVRAKLAIHRQEMRAYYDRVVARNYRNRRFQEGQLVWVQIMRQTVGPVPTIQPKFIGPYRIVEIRDHTVGLRSVLFSRRGVKHVHKDRLRQCLLADADYDLLDEMEVDQLDDLLEREADGTQPSS